MASGFEARFLFKPTLPPFKRQESQKCDLGLITLSQGWAVNVRVTA